MIRRIAVAQGGGPTPVINDSLAGVMYEAKKRGIEVIGLRNGVEGGGLNPEIPSNLIQLDFNPKLIRGIPGAYLGTTRLKLNGKEKDKIHRLRENLDSLGIETLIYIGGNDSAATILEEGNGIHVIKTIDNDVPENDHTPGYGSACRANRRMIRALVADMSGFSARVLHNGKTVYSTAPIVVYQTQGRNAGWLALGCAFTKINSQGEFRENDAPHLFLTRETPYNKDELLGKVDNLLRKQGFAFIVCGEELVNEEGKKLSEVYGNRESKDPFGHVEHARSGAFNYADFIASEIKKGLAREVREARGLNGYLDIKETPISPQHIPRCLTRLLVDANEAYEAGREAVRAFDENNNNVSIALIRNGDSYSIKPARVPLESVAGKVRVVDEKYLGTIEGPTEQFYNDFASLVLGPLGRTHYNGPELRAWKPEK